MATATAEPRGKLSIWLIGLILGPIVLMLWLGRGRLALVYLLVQLILIGAGLLVVGSGLVAPPVIADPDIMAFLLNLPLNVVGLVHGLNIRMPPSRPWFSRWYVAIPLPIAASWIIPLIIRELLLQPYSIPSGSMIPSLMPGDHAFASKLAYGYSRYSFLGWADFSGRVWSAEPKRGDIVVFKLPSDNETDYVKRLIGLPGDRVQLRDGIVYLNGKPLELAPARDVPCWEPECNFFRETLPDGRSYIINNDQPNGLADNTQEYVVPAGHYFMLGDNRDNALDSRFPQDGPGGGVGFVPSENLIGPIVLIFWNSYGIRIDDRLRGYPGR